jgi:hypothetical protein
MKAKRWLFAAAALLALGPVIAALVEQDWLSALIRCFPSALLGAMAVREFRSPMPPRAWKRRQVVMFALLMVPLTLLLYGAIIWVAVVSGDLVMQLVCAAILVVFSGLMGLGGWVLWKEHLLATGAAGTTGVAEA